MGVPNSGQILHKCGTEPNAVNFLFLKIELGRPVFHIIPYKSLSQQVVEDTVQAVRAVQSQKSLSICTFWANSGVPDYLTSCTAATASFCVYVFSAKGMESLFEKMKFQISNPNFKKYSNNKLFSFLIKHPHLKLNCDLEIFQV